MNSWKLLLALVAVAVANLATAHPMHAEDFMKIDQTIPDEINLVGDLHAMSIHDGESSQ